MTERHGSSLEIAGLRKSFDDKIVLDGVNLGVRPGESLVIIGGSGAGKSVLLKCILGLIQPDSGTILIDGVDMTDQRSDRTDAVRERIGMLFQGGALFDSMPVWRNITFALTQGRARDSKKMHALAIEMLEKVGLEPRVADLRPAEISGGMQKRVALARAIAANPDLIFFDEPTTGLDPIRANTINQLIRGLVTDLGCTAVTITHDMASAHHIADQVAMLHEGRIVWAGPVDQLDKSGNELVDRFIHGRTD
ncbi:ABC transporter ATP-binding protein [Pacificimonas flava]|uniref:ABC transporter ATP-binding protein n=2 Tax=Pacificimonas TaxID=1960290 RepID=A0A219B1I5_9SPHN|nr:MULTISPECIES: ATP-binding cassette domain-containing protein [Pacificimonas]MBZ6378161.1 ATP-binding cassette domain-containing protein [Pacificimonas aurantium]OWV32207.1 ABC transporter ATP-binding protein [Pacificimonas flava]